MAVDVTKTTFKKMEYEWHNYHNTLKEIAKLREEIIRPFNPDPDENTGGGSNSVRVPGDPTGRVAIRLTTSKQLTYLTEIADAIEKVYNVLPNDYKELVRVRYWNNRKINWDCVASELHVSRSTAIRWRNEIIQATIELLGWR